MSGLEKIKSQILEEANAAAQSKTAQAQAQAQEILDAAKAKGDELAKSIIEKAEIQAKNFGERAQSSAELKRKTSVLTSKQEVISDVMKKAFRKLTNMQEGEYFELVLKLAEKYVLAKEGGIFFSAKDIARMPADVKQSILKIAADKGGSLEILQSEKEFDGGFVLAYGGIEENCTFKAIFEAKKDEITDAIYKIIFA